MRDPWSAERRPAWPRSTRSLAAQGRRASPASEGRMGDTRDAQCLPTSFDDVVFQRGFRFRSCPQRTLTDARSDERRTMSGEHADWKLWARGAAGNVRAAMGSRNTTALLHLRHSKTPVRRRVLLHLATRRNVRRIAMRARVTVPARDDGSTGAWRFVGRLARSHDARCTSRSVASRSQPSSLFERLSANHRDAQDDYAGSREARLLGASPTKHRRRCSWDVHIASRRRASARARSSSIR